MKPKKYFNEKTIVSTVIVGIVSAASVILLYSIDYSEKIRQEQNQAPLIQRSYDSTRARFDSLAGEVISENLPDFNFQLIDPNIAFRIMPYPIDTSLGALTQSNSRLEEFLGMSNALKGARKLYEQ